jgi:hypothetical protein
MLKPAALSSRIISSLINYVAFLRNFDRLGGDAWSQTFSTLCRKKQSRLTSLQDL